MRRACMALIVLLLFSQAAKAASLKSFTSEISIQDDKTTEWVVTFEYDSNITRSDYYILSNIVGVEVTANSRFIECPVKSLELGTSITCENLNASKIVYKFRSLDKVSDLQGLSVFSHRFSVTQPAEKFSVIVKLPLGTAIVEKSKLESTGLNPFEPPWGKEGSDGRSIFIEWDVDRPDLGMMINTSVIYEQVIQTDQLFSLGIILTISFVFLLIVIMFRRKTVSDVMPILTDSERKIMEIVMKEKSGVDQRKIVKEMDFSKSKVSRIIHNLSSRGLVESVRKGRANIVKLKNRV